VCSSDLSAYLAGLLSADGCIKKSGVSTTCYVVDLLLTDKSLIDRFKSFVHTKKPIYVRHRDNKKTVYGLTVFSPFILENLKFWNIKPRKSIINEIPDIIKDNNELLICWLIGLIDGDGHIKTKNNKNPKISCLCSKSIAEYIKINIQSIR
jgi:hypothetical protein